MAELFYKDKSKVFECKLSIEGASLDDSSARLRLNFDNINYLFEGTIDRNGQCKIKVPPLRHAPEDAGLITLEVIADETYFEPWSSDFNIKRNKNVTVEITSTPEVTTKPTIKVETKHIKKKPAVDNSLKETISLIDKKMVLEIIKNYTKMSKKNKFVMDKIAENHHPSGKSKKEARTIFNDPTSTTAKLYMYYVDSVRK